MNKNRRGFIASIGCLTLSACVSTTSRQNINLKEKNNTKRQKMNKPIIIAHRGASGYRPEHTLASYELAIMQNCDFIEPDLVITKDGHLICRHENNITETTNVATISEFANRKTTKTIDGETHVGWFTEDFTLSEIKTLRARERLPLLRQQNVKYNDLYEIPTFEEVLQLRLKKSLELGREIGVYPETKHPSYFASKGLHFDEQLLKLLNQYNLNNETAPIFIQSFETKNLQILSQKTKVRLIQLMQEEGGPWDSQTGFIETYKNLTKPEKLLEISQYAYGIGPQKTMIIPWDKDKKMMAATNLVSDAHAVGLKLHPWTFRAENYFLPLNFKKGMKLDPFYEAEHGDLMGEIKCFLELGIDGLFCDFPDIAFKAINEI